MALSIFDKQVLPILTYGSAVWGVPSFTNHLYVDNIPIDKSTTAAIRTFINEVTKKHTKLEWVRKVKTPAECFGISMMVKFSNYDDKQKLFSSLDMNKTLIRLRNVNCDHDNLIYEKVHTKYYMQAMKLVGEN